MAAMTNRAPTLGGRLSQTRRFVNLDQTQMGERLNVSKNTICNWETERTTPTVHQLVDWADIVGFPVEWFIEDLHRGDDARAVTRGSTRRGKSPPRHVWCRVGRLRPDPALTRRAAVPLRPLGCVGRPVMRDDECGQFGRGGRPHADGC